MGCFVRGDKNGMGRFVQGDKNCMGCFVRGGKLMRDVLSGVLKNGMGCFVPGCFVLHSNYGHVFISLDMTVTTSHKNMGLIHITCYCLFSQFCGLSITMDMCPSLWI